MQVHPNRTIQLSEPEWQRMQELLGNAAVWRPRSIDEHNAMCDLGAACARNEDTGIDATRRALACLALRFNDDDTPSAAMVITEDGILFLQEFGQVPDDEQMADWRAGRPVKLRPPEPPQPRIRLVSSNATG